jgi:hypothetical protein
MKQIPKTGKSLLLDEEDVLSIQVVESVKEVFLKNPTKPVTKLAISLFASLLIKKMGSNVSITKRKKILDDALKILLKSKKK